MNIEQYERLSMQKLKGSNNRTKASEGAITVSMLGAQGSNFVTQQGSLQIEAFYSSVKDKSETIGQLPLRLYEKDKEGNRVEVKKGRTWKLFTQQPCDYMTMQGFLEMVVVSLETNGAFYAYKERNDRGNIKAIIPFRNQANVVPNMDMYGRVYYTYVTNDGKIQDPYRVEDLVIIKNFTTDGYTPISPIRYMATILGIADVQEDSYKELQEGGITSQMALATDASFNDENALKRLKDDWDTYRGPSGRRNIPILEQGLKPVSLKLTPAETDLLKHREFSVKRISAMTGVPLYRINMDEGKVSKGVLPELDESYMRNKLSPVLVKVEKALNALLPETQSVEVNRKAYYSGSPWRLVEHVTSEFTKMGCTLNEMREDLGREPVEGGDVFAIDTNNLTLGKLDELDEIQERLYGAQPQNQPQQENTNNE